MWLEWLLIGVGFVALLYVLYRLLVSLFNILGPYVLFRPIDLKKRAGASWAVVTGATDGIGKSYTFELASRGFNVFLVSRTQSRLDTTKREILERHPQVEALLATLNEVNIGVLINNVGAFYEYPEVLHKVEGGVAAIANIVTINTLPPTLLSAGIIPQMLTRKAGIIVYIGSFAGASKMSEWAVYSAAKKYVSWFTAILRKEYGNQGITFQNIAPMMVDSFAKSALNTIGHVGETTGYFSHQIQAEGMSLLPEFVVDRAIVGVSAKIRNAALEKKEQRKLLS
ncbi:unnamed protein product [Caenorhabditis sp. 36 PRJEB53466]|nr:unnamed protein product [Caenorhabditis sp. 36 PRJEB53466]